MTLSFGAVEVAMGSIDNAGLWENDAAFGLEVWNDELVALAGLRLGLDILSGGTGNAE
jgi:hypothetical protein